MAKAFAATLAILLFFAGFVVYRTGYLKPVTISSGFQGPFILVYKKHQGPYHKIAPVIDSVEDFFNQKGLDCPLAFGRYLHDPNTTPHDRLQSHGGCAFPGMTPQLQKVLKEADLEVENLPKEEYLVASFAGSPSIGPWKVYPHVEDWLQKYGYQKQETVIELYQTMGVDAVQTRYLFRYR
jgi:hypothetical protein